MNYNNLFYLQGLFPLEIKVLRVVIGGSMVVLKITKQN